MMPKELFTLEDPADLAGTMVGLPMRDRAGGAVVGRIVACVATTHNVAITIEYLDGRQEMRKLVTDEMRGMYEYLLSLNPFKP